MDQFTDIGLKIRKARLSKNLTMEYVAKEVGITRTTLFAIEKGKANCSAKSLFKLFKLLGINFEIKSSCNEYKRIRATRTNSKKDKNINRFIVMCIEMYARYKEETAQNVYLTLNKKGILKNLCDDYEDLHSMGTEWLNDYIDSLVRVY